MRHLWIAVLAVSLLVVPKVRAAEDARELAGVWEAKLRFGPELRGPLVIEQRNGAWRAEINGRFAPVKVDGEAVSFRLADGEGSFAGRFEAKRARIFGHWTQPRTMSNGTTYASPVTLVKSGSAWRGDVVPLDDELTMYLKVEPREDGSVGAFLRNPERNAGRFLRVETLERDGRIVRLLGKGNVIAEGTYVDGSLTIGLRGGTYDFQRVGDGQGSDFYPRRRSTAPYVYAPPRAGDDGWPVATLDEVGISREAITRFLQTIVDTPMDSLSAMEIHGVLIARYGKLVVEEYFHGEHRDKPHDTRSAAKSVTSTLIGAAIQSGVPLTASSPVYRVMNGGTFPEELEPRKRAVTLEHLMTMTSGLDCDDADSDSPGAEDNVTQQSEEPDWVRLILKLGMIRDPGTKAVYCSINPHLAGAVLQKAAGQPLPMLFHALIAEPLQMRRYHMNLTPTGDAYMGGGMRFLPRDFMKLGQLMLNEGTWNGRRVLSREWVRRAVSPLYELHGVHYGYNWYATDLPYHGRTVRVFYAGGNGGQVVMGVPELDLLICFWGGNYSDPVLFTAQRVYVPESILPAVGEPAR